MVVATLKVGGRVGSYFGSSISMIVSSLILSETTGDTRIMFVCQLENQFIGNLSIGSPIRS